MKDPVTGSLTNLFTSRFWLKGQNDSKKRFRIKSGMTGRGAGITKRKSANDPINKIDPAGTQFYTTVAIPPDPPSKPPDCFSSCVIPFMTPNGLQGGRCRDCSIPSIGNNDYSECMNVSCKLEGEDLSKYFYDPNGSVLNDYTGASFTVLSGSLGDFAATTSTSPPDSGIIKQPNKDYDIKYEVDEDGNVTLSAVDKNGNTIKLPESEQRVLDNIQKRINDALNWLGDQGFKFNDLRASKKVIMNFISKYASMFYSITGGETAENAYELAYNATVGLAIASQMQRYGINKDYNKYDQEIGFWVSFWSRKSEIKMEFKSKDINETLGLVDLANLVKAIAYQETHVGTDAATNTPNYYNMGGIMQVEYGINYQFETSWAAAYGRGLKFYNTGKEFFDPFNNIGIGVGCLFAKLTINSDYPYNLGGARNSPKTEYWFQAVRAYGPHKNGKPVPDYWTNIHSILFTGYSSRDKKQLFDPKKYYP